MTLVAPQDPMLCCPKTQTYKGKEINRRRLKTGNAKLKKMYIFDLPALEACPNSTLCASTCYAARDQRIYPDVMPWRQMNHKLAIFYPDLLKHMIVYQLHRGRLHVCRIHSSGDFYSQNYIDMWHDIISRFPGITFYAYTKCIGLPGFNFERIESNPNFNLINSIIDGKLNYGPRKEMEALAEQHDCLICPSVKSHKEITCNQGCTHCFSNKNVVFIKH